MSGNLLLHLHGTRAYRPRHWCHSINSQATPLQ